METVFRTARDNAIVYAHQMMRRARALLAPVLTRAERIKARAALRLAEAFLRRGFCLIAAEMAGELPPPCPSGPTQPKRARRKKVRGLALIEPTPRFGTGAPLPDGVFDGLEPSDSVTPGTLVARHARLQAALAHPLRLARRLAFWQRRQRRTGRQALHKRPVLPGPKAAAGRDTLDWLEWIDSAVRDARPPEPG